MVKKIPTTVEPRSFEPSIIRKMTLARKIYTATAVSLFARMAHRALVSVSPLIDNREIPRAVYFSHFSIIRTFIESLSWSLDNRGSTEVTGYILRQTKGQRTSTPPGIVGAEPPRGCEIFIGRIPRYVYEDILIPVFSTVGVIYELRLMMDFSGSNRGYAFLKYANRAQAVAAVTLLDRYEILAGHRIGVVMSLDNCHLFLRDVPILKTKKEFLNEFKKHLKSVVDVNLYKHSNGCSKKGYAVVEFESHRAAAMGRRLLVPGLVRLFNQVVKVEWAEMQLVNDNGGSKPTNALYIRNLPLDTNQNSVKNIIENIINNKVYIKKTNNFAFVQFHKKEHAEHAKNVLHKTDIGGFIISVKWAKPNNGEKEKSNTELQCVNVRNIIPIVDNEYIEENNCSPDDIEMKHEDFKNFDDLKSPPVAEHSTMEWPCYNYPCLNNISYPLYCVPPASPIPRSTWYNPGIYANPTIPSTWCLYHPNKPI